MGRQTEKEIVHSVLKDLLKIVFVILMRTTVNMSPQEEEKMTFSIILQNARKEMKSYAFSAVTLSDKYKCYVRLFTSLLWFVILSSSNLWMKKSDSTLLYGMLDEDENSEVLRSCGSGEHE